MDSPTIDYPYTDVPHMRLLVCRTCKTIDELPDYEGRPENDDLLNVLVERHPDHIGALFRVPIGFWLDEGVKAKIVSQLTEGSKGLAEIVPEHYDLKNTFMEDAMTCFKKHQRPSEGCPDWRHDSKVLLPNTKADRKAEGLPLTPVGPKRYLCDFCLSADTEVVTRDGIQRIGDLSGKTPELLIPFRAKGGSISARGSFVATEVHYFGEQETYDVVLRSGMSKKTVRATAEHRWILEDGEETVTEDLRAGMRLKSLLAVAPRSKEKIMSVAVAQGFVFGDGTSYAEDRRPAKVTFHGSKDEQMLPFFTGADVSTVTMNGEQHVHINGLPRFWKDLPPIQESRTFLLSWFSGYFAADGTVDAKGSARISSARVENLEFVRSLLAVCGVRSWPITRRMRDGFGDGPSELYNLTFDARAMPEWFWHIDAHRERVFDRLDRTKVDRGWSVESITYAQVEPVYCAVVPDVASFALSDGLMTGNCPVRSHYERKARGE